MIAKWFYYDLQNLGSAILDYSRTFLWKTHGFCGSLPEHGQQEEDAQRGADITLHRHHVVEQPSALECFHHGNPQDRNHAHYHHEQSRK